MVDPGTGLALLGGAVGSAKLVENIPGPTADYLGGGLRNWTEKGAQNLGAVFRNATHKLGDRIEQPGTVPPKVLKAVLDEGAFSEDPLAAEYFGGVLASSRTEVGRDDRGAAFAGLIGRLTTYQLRSHYFFYATIRELYASLDVNLGVPNGRLQCQSFIPFSSYLTAMEFTAAENADIILSHVMFGLTREDLIESPFQFGKQEHVRQFYAAAKSGGILFAPSALGVELFLWAHGRGDLPMSAILDPTANLRSGIRIQTAPGIHSVRHSERAISKPQPSAPPAREDEAHPQ